MPKLVANSDFDWQMFYGAYVRTYIERDVHDLTQVGDEVNFIRFMISIAAKIGSLLNLSEIARDVGISQPTSRTLAFSSRSFKYSLFVIALF